MYFNERNITSQNENIHMQGLDMIHMPTCVHVQVYDMCICVQFALDGLG